MGSAKGLRGQGAGAGVSESYCRELGCQVQERKWTGWFQDGCSRRSLLDRRALPNGEVSRDGFRWWGGSRVVANGSPNGRSRIWRATSFSVVIQNPKSEQTVSPWSPHLGSGEAALKVFDFLTSSRLAQHGAPATRGRL